MTSLIKKVKFSGVGIHSGLPVNMIVKPSKKQGIFFKRAGEYTATIAGI